MLFFIPVTVVAVMAISSVSISSVTVLAIAIMASYIHSVQDNCHSVELAGRVVIIHVKERTTVEQTCTDNEENKVGILLHN